MRSIRLLTIMLLVSLSTNVIAQEQTVEGAQDFLSKVLPGVGYIPGTFSSVKWHESSDHRVRSSGKGRITEIRSPDRCRTAIFFDPSSLAVESNGRVYYQSRPTQRWKGWEKSQADLATALSLENYRAGAIAGAPSGFSWSDVLEVKISSSGTDVLITHKGLREPTLVELGAKDMATRVAYAMEFLRSNCDKAAGTGF